MSIPGVFLAILIAAAVADIAVAIGFQMTIGIGCSLVGGWIAMQSTDSRISFPLMIGGAVLVAAKLF